jgi:hypothetical protein
MNNDPEFDLHPDYASISIGPLGLQLHGRQFPGEGTVAVECMYSTCPLTSRVSQRPQSPTKHPDIMVTPLDSAK